MGFKQRVIRRIRQLAGIVDQTVAPIVLRRHLSMTLPFSNVITINYLLSK